MLLLLQASRYQFASIYRPTRAVTFNITFRSMVSTVFLVLNPSGRGSNNLDSTSSGNGGGKYIPTSTHFHARYTGPNVEDMNEEQIVIREDILSTRKGTGLSGPFGPWLAIPEIAAPAQQLGRACRYGTSLSFRESELVILLTGAKTRSHAEFDIHVGEALRAGLEMKAIQSIPRDDDFSVEAVEAQVVPLLANDREKAMARFVAELLETYTISDETYEMTKAALDHQDSTLVELVSIAGYYTYVSYTLNAFRIPSKSPDSNENK